MSACCRCLGRMDDCILVMIRLCRLSVAVDEVVWLTALFFGA